MTSKDIITQESLEKAIRNKEFPGFETDYLVIDSLIRGRGYKRFCEVGTNFGTGTKIIKNALGEFAEVWTLDLPEEQVCESLKGNVGINFKGQDFITQYRGDSLTFDYFKEWGPKIDGIFIDGAHTFEHVFHETKEILKLWPEIIIWHDADIPEVWEAIEDACEGSNHMPMKIKDCRIAYSLSIKLQ